MEVVLKTTSMGRSLFLKPFLGKIENKPVMLLLFKFLPCIQAAISALWGINVHCPLIDETQFGCSALGRGANQSQCFSVSAMVVGGHNIPGESLCNPLGTVT
jgi:hypothetical protein